MKSLGKNTATISKQILLDDGGDTEMIVSFFGNAHGAALMIYITYSKTFTLK